MTGFRVLENGAGRATEVMTVQRVLESYGAVVTPPAGPSWNLGDYDASDSTNTAKMTVVSGKVSALLDQSAAGNDFAQATATNRPAVAVDHINGLDAIRFTAFPDPTWLTRAEANMVSTATLTVQWVARFEPTSAPLRMLALRSSGQADWNNISSAALGADSSHYPTGYRNSSELGNNGAFATDAYHCVTYVFDGTNERTYLDRTLIGTVANTGNFDVDEFWLGAGVNGADPSWNWLGQLRLSSTAADAAQLTASWDELLAKWGVPA